MTNRILIMSLNILLRTTMKNSISNLSNGPSQCTPKPPISAARVRLGVIPFSLRPPNSLSITTIVSRTQTTKCFLLPSLNKSHLGSRGTQILVSSSQNTTPRKQSSPHTNADSQPKSLTVCERNLSKSGRIARPHPQS